MTYNLSGKQKISKNTRIAFIVVEKNNKEVFSVEYNGDIIVDGKTIGVASESIIETLKQFYSMDFEFVDEEVRIGHLMGVNTDAKDRWGGQILSVYTN